MKSMRRLPLMILLLLSLTPAGGAAQVDLSVGCSPGIPNCGSLRFFISAAGSPLSLNSLFLRLLTPGWIFVAGPSPTSGTYSAEDSFGPFGGFTTISEGGTALGIDFTENGFPFEVFAGETGLLDVEAAGGTDATSLAFHWEVATTDGEVITGVVPEPASVILLASGLAGLAAARRRRREPDRA